MNWLKALDPGPRTRTLASLYDNEDATKQLLRRVGLVGGLGGVAGLGALALSRSALPWEHQDALEALDVLGVSDYPEEPSDWTLADALESQRNVDISALNAYRLPFGEMAPRALDHTAQRIMGYFNN